MSQRFFVICKKSTENDQSSERLSMALARMNEVKSGNGVDA